METDRYEINNEKEMGQGVGKRDRKTWETESPRDPLKMVPNLAKEYFSKHF